MTIELKMPALSPTMEKGTLAKWLVAEGDMVKPGDMIAEIETDKATMEFEAIDEGRVTSLVIAEGTADVPVGTVIAMLAEEGEAVSEPAVAAAAPVAVPASAPAAPIAPKHAPEVTAPRTRLSPPTGSVSARWPSASRKPRASA